MIEKPKFDECGEPCPHPESMSMRVADRAVKRVFAILGVDVDNPEQVAEFQADLRFGRRMRKAADHGFLAAIGLVAVGLGAVVWEGISSKLGGR